jgi:nucleoside-diphosphate-sugar epimerase
MILVTGGKGYVGSKLVEALAWADKKVRVIDNNYYDPNGVNIVHGVEYIIKDIRDIKIADLNDIEAIIHLAGISNDPTAEYNTDRTFFINVEGTKLLARYAKEKKIRKFIFASTCSIYDSFNSNNLVTKELYDTKFISNIETSPKYPYSESKYLAELFLGKMSEKGIFEPVVFRKGTIFGLSTRMRFDLAINAMMKDLILKKSIRLDNFGQMWRPFLSIESAVQTYKNTLNNYDDFANKTLNVLDININIAHLALIIQREYPDSKFEFNDITKPRSYLVYRDIGGELDVFSLKKYINVFYHKLILLDKNEFNNPIYYNIEWMKLVDLVMRTRKD